MICHFECVVALYDMDVLIAQFIGFEIFFQQFGRQCCRIDFKIGLRQKMPQSGHDIVMAM